LKTLIDCDRGDIVTIKRLHTAGELKQRLISFGLMRGAKVKVLEFAPAKKTIEIKVNSTRVALRGDEAALIEVIDES